MDAPLESSDTKLTAGINRKEKNYLNIKDRERGRNGCRGTSERCKGRLKRSNKINTAINPLRNMSVTKASPGNGKRIHNFC